jgi:hypothetical protein
VWDPDISPQITTTRWHTIEVTSATLGVVVIQVGPKCYLKIV